MISGAAVIKKDNAKKGRKKEKKKTSLTEQLKSARAVGVMNLLPCARHKHVKAPELELELQE